MGQARSRFLSVSVQSCRHFTRSESTCREIGILGAPLRSGQRKKGVEEAPKFLREAGVIQRLEALGYTVKDYGDVAVEGNPDLIVEKAIESDVVGKTTKNIRDAVAAAVSSGRLTVNLGGDHSSAIGTVTGHAAATHSDVALIWIDAHADMNTVRSSGSGNLHGMPVSFLLHEMAHFVTKPPSLEWVQPCVHKENFAFIALRDVDSYERYFIDHLGITTFGMAEIDRVGIRETIQRVLKKINPTGTKSLHVSFDIDSIDKLIAPSTGTSVIGGLTMREAFVIAEEVHQSGQLRVLDLTEVNPRLGTVEEVTRTVGCGVDVISAFFGNQRNGNLPLEVDSAVVGENAVHKRSR
ncbi:arginase-1 [Ixodes scapularis]|uniref:arginase-1 n=1 Tax=Ixodes scapularis TaxID=6945 RepID=UPI001A9CD26C|nr:arginase-1 [Ixodes scapularis]